MQVHFQLTYDDFREASFGKAGWSPLIPIAVTWCIALFWLALLIAPYVLQPQDPQADAEPVSTMLAAPTVGGRMGQVLQASGTAIAFIGVPMLVIIAALFKKPASPWKPSKPSLAARIRIVGIGVAIGVLVIWLANQPASAPFITSVTVMPAGASFLLILVFLIVNHVRTPANQWALQTHLHLTTTMEMGEGGGLTFRDAEATLHYRWPAIKGYRETENLLLLYLSPLSFWMVPKRAFASLTDLAVFKQRLAENVPEGTFASGGQAFAVDAPPQPAQPVAGIPPASVPYATAIEGGGKTVGPTPMPHPLPAQATDVARPGK